MELSNGPDIYSQAAYFLGTMDYDNTITYTPFYLCFMEFCLNRVKGYK